MSAFAKLIQSIGSLATSFEEVGPRRLVAKAEPKDLRAIFKKLIEDYREDFYLDFLAVVDYVEEKQIDVSYNLWLYGPKTVLTIKFRLPRDSPTIETISDLIPSAIYHEKEAYDLMGVTFSGNSDLTRGFLVAEEAQDRFPLRKDEVKQA